MTAARVRAMVLTGDRRLEAAEFARPAIGADDALLRVEACGMCGTDLEQYDGHMAQSGYVKYPFIPGHEPIGIIEEIGPGAAKRWGVAAGDRVAVEPLIPCRSCEACRAGRTTECSGWGRVYSYGMLDTAVESALLGGYAEHLHLQPNSVVHKVSRALPVEVAVMFNPMGAGVHWGVGAGDVKADDTVVILGAGQRGLTCLLAARAAGARVIVTDVARASNKLDLALELGADAVIVADEEDSVARVEELTAGRFADVVVDVSAMATQPVLDAVEMVRRGGTIVLAGLKGGRAIPEFVSDTLVYKSITMRGVFTVSSHAYAEAIRLIESDTSGVFARLHTRSYPLERTEEAILHLAGRTGEPPAVHVAIVP